MELFPQRRPTAKCADHRGESSQSFPGQGTVVTPTSQTTQLRLSGGNNEPVAELGCESPQPYSSTYGLSHCTWPPHIWCPRCWKLVNYLSVTPRSFVCTLHSHLLLSSVPEVTLISEEERSLQREPSSVRMESLPPAPTQGSPSPGFALRDPYPSALFSDRTSRRENSVSLGMCVQGAQRDSMQESTLPSLPLALVPRPPHLWCTGPHIVLSRCQAALRPSIQNSSCYHQSSKISYTETREMIG